VPVAPPPAGKKLLLGVPASADDKTQGFRPKLGVHPPAKRYYIHQHEITWAELDPWLAKHPEHKVMKLSWVPKDAAKRGSLPATGIYWTTAYEYCKSIGARLPTEEQWEYAARGPELRRYAWGNARLDLERTHVFAGPKARPVAVMTSEQDKTPSGIYDLMGNAQEWTADPWRENWADLDESWTQAKGQSFRALRGLPLAKKPPRRRPRWGAAHREVLCSAGSCVRDSESILSTVGFRCTITP
jgi:formylglycine-generating enzyme required for sulfatase activity